MVFHYNGTLYFKVVLKIVILTFKIQDLNGDKHSPPYLLLYLFFLAFVCMECSNNLRCINNKRYFSCLHCGPLRDIRYIQLLRIVTKEVLYTYLILSCMQFKQNFYLIKTLIFYVSYSTG